MLWALLAGCSTHSGALFETLWSGVTGVDGASMPLDPQFRYLRVGHGEYSSYMILGFSEQQPVGELEAWYSPAGEVVKFLNGRIVGTAGLPTDWREVRLPPLPGWREVPPEGVCYTREIDQMPAYRYGRAQTLYLRPVPPPADARLVRAQADQLSWFEETPVGGEPDALPPSRYGVDLKQSPPSVVYTEQCVSAPLCFTFERWPVAAQPDTTGKPKEPS